MTKYERRPSREVRIGRVVIGGNRPIAVQSMTNTDTKDTEACVRQIERIFRAGGPIVRLTAQGCREGENLQRCVSIPETITRRTGSSKPSSTDAGSAVWRSA